MFVFQELPQKMVREKMFATENLTITSTITIDEMIASIQNANSIQMFGPGEAKSENSTNGSRKPV